MDKILEVSFFCFYEENITKHFRKMPVKDIPEWMLAYKFTHPDVIKISAMVKTEGWNITSEDMPF